MVFKFFISNREDLHKNRALRLKYSPIYEEFNVDPEPKDGVIAFAVYYYLRRICLALAVVMVRDFFVGQFFIFVMAVVCQVIFLGLVKPFKSKNQNKVEIINEIMIMLTMYHMFFFTDYVRDERLRYNLGYSCLSIVFIHLSFNFALITWITLTGLQWKAKVKLARHHQKFQRVKNKQKFKDVGQKYVKRRKTKE